MAIDGWAVTDWAGPQPAQAPPRCSKCNSPPINGRLPIILLLYNGSLLCSLNVPIKGQHYGTLAKKHFSQFTHSPCFRPNDNSHLPSHIYATFYHLPKHCYTSMLFTVIDILAVNYESKQMIYKVSKWFIKCRSEIRIGCMWVTLNEC